MKGRGVLVDFHGTIVDSNQAWVDAFFYLSNCDHEVVIQKVYRKTDRRLMCQELGIDFADVVNKYRDFLKVRQEALDVIRLLSGDGKIIIVSHSSRKRLLADIDKVSSFLEFDIVDLFSKEDGRKGDETISEKISTGRTAL